MTTAKKDILAFLNGRIQEFSKFRNLICSQQYSASFRYVDAQVGTYEAARDYLGGHSVEELLYVIKNEPAKTLHGFPPGEVLADISSFIEKSAPLFNSVLDLADYWTRERQQILQLQLEANTAAAREAQLAEEKKKNELKKRKQAEVAEQLGLSPEAIAKLST